MCCLRGAAARGEASVAAAANEQDGAEAGEARKKRRGRRRRHSPLTSVDHSRLLLVHQPRRRRLMRSFRSPTSCALGPHKDQPSSSGESGRSSPSRGRGRERPGLCAGQTEPKCGSSYSPLSGGRRAAAAAAAAQCASVCVCVQAPHTCSLGPSLALALDARLALPLFLFLFLSLLLRGSLVRVAHFQPQRASASLPAGSPLFFLLAPFPSHRTPLGGGARRTNKPTDRQTQQHYCGAVVGREQASQGSSSETTVRVSTFVNIYQTRPRPATLKRSR